MWHLLVFHYSCNMRKPCCLEQPQKQLLLPLEKCSWDFAGAFAALQLIIRSIWLLPCPHYLGFLLALPWPINDATFQAFLLWLFMAISLLNKLLPSLRKGGQRGAWRPVLRLAPPPLMCWASSPRSNMTPKVQCWTFRCPGTGRYQQLLVMLLLNFIFCTYKCWVFFWSERHLAKKGQEMVVCLLF